MPVKRIRGRRLQRIRRDVLRASPLCAHCHAEGRVALATEIDHVVALRFGGSDDASNRQPLCAACHASKTILERGDRERGCDVDGLPTSRAHHWRSSEKKTGGA